MNFIGKILAFISSMLLLTISGKIIFSNLFHYLADKFVTILSAIKFIATFFKRIFSSLLNIKFSNIILKLLDKNFYKAIYIVFSKTFNTEIEKSIGNLHTKWHVYLFSMALFYILALFKVNNFLFNVLLFVSFIIILIAAADFLAFLDRKTAAEFYLLKLIVFFVLSVTYLSVNLSLKNQNFIFLFSSSMFLIVISFCFLKNILDTFDKTIALISHTLVIYLYNLFLFGFCFGYYYLINNDKYQLLNNQVAHRVLYEEDVTINNVLLIVNKGLYYFYTYFDDKILSPIYSTDGKLQYLTGDYLSNTLPFDYIPFLEFIFGATFNVIFVGFLVSYLASKAFAKITKDDSDIVKQLQGKTLSFTIKKED